MSSLNGKRILLIIGGGIAAYKVLDLIRRLKERGASVRAVMTDAAEQFITPLSVGALTAERVYRDLFDLSDEQEIGHIRLSREADLVVIAPATADLLAKMASGLCNDLASTVLLATDKPVLAAPAMNPFMWAHAATRRNVAQLTGDGIVFVGPERGEMAESGEAGVGRMAEPMTIVSAVEARLSHDNALLGETHVIVTSGPTHEPIDPVRYIANRSSGKQGHAIAAAFARAGARVTLISGPVEIDPPAGVDVKFVESARQMYQAVEAALPADIAVMAAAVADWRVATDSKEKIKKDGNGPPSLELIENPDILAAVSRHEKRPALVIGFAAETRSVTEHAQAKLKRKGCDWIVANDVTPETGIMGGTDNDVQLITANVVEDWPPMAKSDVADRLVKKAAEFLKG